MLLHKLSKFMRGLAYSRSEERRFAALAWAASPLVELTLRLAGLERTVRLIEQLSDRAATVHRRGGSASTDVVDGERLVRLAYRAHPLLRGGCLERSLVQYGLHRLDLTAARLVIGVRRPERADEAMLDAHAWIEAPGGAAPSHDFEPLLVREHAPIPKA